MSDIIDVQATVVLDDAQFITNQIQLGDQALLKGLEHYINAGERLIQVRKQIEAEKAKLSESNWKQNGFKTREAFRKWKSKQPTMASFLSWMITNLPNLGQAHAYRYIALAENKDLIQNASSINEALRIISNKGKTQQQIDDEIEAKALEHASNSEQNALVKVDQIQSQLAKERQSRERLEAELKELKSAEPVVKVEVVKVEVEKEVDLSDYVPAKDYTELEERLRLIEEASSSRAKDQTNSLNKTIQQQNKQIEALKKELESKPTTDESIIEDLRFQLEKTMQELKQSEGKLENLKDRETPLDYKGFTPYEVELAERVLNGETVVASMHNFKNPYGTPFLQWVQKMNLGVKIDRSTEWGNPFTEQDGDLETRMISFMDHYFPRKLSLVKKTSELKGKVLLCWCKKDKDGSDTARLQACHGDILADYANGVRK